MTRHFFKKMDRRKRLRSGLSIALAACLYAGAAQGDSPPAAASDPIPYSSLDEAMKALRSKPGVTFRSEGGWIVADDSAAIVVWLLTPVGHPAYPSIVKRHIVNSTAGAEMATDIRCFAPKLTCDKYFGGNQSSF